jgi:archaellum component FlaC
VDKLDQLSEQVEDVVSNVTKVGRNIAKFKDEWEALENCNIILRSPTAQMLTGSLKIRKASFVLNGYQQ